jgi:hypothetical protein
VCVCCRAPFATKAHRIVSLGRLRVSSCCVQRLCELKQLGHIMHHVVGWGGGMQHNPTSRYMCQLMYTLHVGHACVDIDAGVRGVFSAWSLILCMLCKRLSIHITYPWHVGPCATA